jgi:hypothetical protein
MKIVYLTEIEEQYVKLLAKKYGYNFSQMCRYALLHIDDVSAKMKIKVTVEHSDLIQKRQRELSAIGNNINQIAHQVNIFAVQGVLPEKYFTDVIMPALDKIFELYAEINRDQQRIRKKLYSR